MLVLAACGSGSTTPVDVSPDPASATPTQGRFAMGFAVERVTLRSGDEVKGTATLSLLSPGGATISGSSTLIVFEFTEVGGLGRQVVPVWPTDCAPHRLTTRTPIVAPIAKSGTVPDGPNADWVRQFLADPVVHLPKGDWDITAMASLFDAQACTGLGLPLQTTLRVHVSQ